MKTCLEVYLHDHLAGAAFAIDLLRAMEDRHTHDPLGVFAAKLRLDIDADRHELQRLVAVIQTDPNVIKEALAHLGEKVARLKLYKFSHGQFGTFEALEALALGILGKQALWTSLIALDDMRFRPTDFAALLDRACDQHEQVEERRIELARSVLRGLIE